MILSPAPTDTPAASVIMMLVPVLLPVAVPMFLTNAMPARASDAARPNRRASASARRALFWSDRVGGNDTNREWQASTQPEDPASGARGHGRRRGVRR